MNDWLAMVAWLSALGSGLIAGVFFAFSAFVMKALGRLPAAQGIAAMQSINVVVLNAVFLSVFLGTGVGCLVLLAASVSDWRAPGALALSSGSVIYLAGTIGVTRISNVPRNNALASVDAASIDGATLWADYVVSWTAWNHVRAIAALIATALLVGGLRSLAGA